MSKEALWLMLRIRLASITLLAAGGNATTLESDSEFVNELESCNIDLENVEHQEKLNNLLMEIAIAHMRTLIYALYVNQAVQNTATYKAVFLIEAYLDAHLSANQKQSQLYRVYQAELTDLKTTLQQPH